MKLVFISISYPWFDMSSPGWPSTWWPGVLEKKVNSGFHSRWHLVGRWLNQMFEGHVQRWKHFRWKVLDFSAVTVEDGLFSGKRWRHRLHRLSLCSSGSVAQGAGCFKTSLWEQILMRTADTPVHEDSWLEISQGWMYFVLRCKIFQPVVSDDWMTIWCYKYYIQFQSD